MLSSHFSGDDSERSTCYAGSGSRIPGESGESGDVVLCYVHFQKCVAFCAKAVMKELRKMIEVSALGSGVDTWIMQC